MNRWRGTFIRDQVKALSQVHDVIVVYFKVDNSRLAPFRNYSWSAKESGNLKEYTVTVPKFFPIINQGKYLLCTYRFISRHIIKKVKIDVIHSHLSYPGGFLGTIIQKTKGIPNIITEHTWIKKYFRSFIHKLCVRYALKNCTCIAAVSQALKEDIEMYCTNQVMVVPNVVDTERFRLPDLKRKREERINLGILGGYSNYRKGLDILFKSAALIKNTNFTIHVGGDGSLLDSFKNLARELGVYDNCKFYGEILPENLVEFYSGLDIFVLASRDETFGVVIIEALCCGIPVIATKCGGPQEIITQDTGILVEKENPQQLAEAIELMSKNLDSYDRDVIRGYAIDKYSPDAFNESITRLYQSVLNRKTR